MKRVCPRPSRAEREALTRRLQETTRIIEEYLESPGTRSALPSEIDRRLAEDAESLIAAGYVRLAARVLGVQVPKGRPILLAYYLPPFGNQAPPSAALMIPVPPILCRQRPRSKIWATSALVPPQPPRTPPPRAASAMRIPREPVLTRAIPRSIGRRVERQV